MSTPDLTTSQSGRPSSPSAGASATPLEQEILDEYARLVGNLDNLGALLAELGQNPTPEVLEGLRKLERKTSLVFTLLKSSVYSIVMNQESWEEGQMGVSGMGSTTQNFGGE